MPTRRQFTLSIGVAAIGASFTQSVFGSRQQDTPEITFGQINEEGEWLVLHNEEDTDVDIEDWYINWEARNEEQDQWDQFKEKYGATSIPANGSIKVATGYKEVQDADVQFENDAGRMNNDGGDVYAVYLPDQQTEVANSEENRHEEGGEPSPTASPTATETETETATETETESPTPTESGGGGAGEEGCPTDGK